MNVIITLVIVAAIGYAVYKLRASFTANPTSDIPLGHGIENPDDQQTGTK